jgi:hypothetical protein
MTDDQSTIMDRKLADLYTEEADLMYRLARRMERGARMASAARLAAVRKQIESLSYHAYDAWDAKRMMEKGEP